MLVVIIQTQRLPQTLITLLVLVSARTTIAPGSVVFPKADEKAAAIITTRDVSVTRIVLIRCGVVASMIIRK